MTTSILFEKESDGIEAGRAGVIAVFGDMTEVEQLRDSVRAIAALRVEQLVRAYRERGHVLATLDPLGLSESGKHPELESAHYGIDDSELDEIHTILWGGTAISQPLREILEKMHRVYCGAVGIQ